MEKRLKKLGAAAVVRCWAVGSENESWREEPGNEKAEAPLKNFGFTSLL